VDELPNLQGFEYYTGGVFEYSEASPNSASSAQTFDIGNKVWDWRNVHGENWLTGVRNQGSIGTCWLFATIGAIEAGINLYYNQHLDLDLSEQMILDCFARYNNPNNPGVIDELYTIEACSELPLSLWASPQQVAACRIKVAGVADEACDKYDSRDLRSEPDAATNCDADHVCSNWQQRLWSIGGYAVYDQLSEAQIKKMLVEEGPLEASLIKWNHAMVLVGWVDDYYDWKVLKYCSKPFSGGDPYAYCYPGESQCRTGWCDTPGERMEICYRGVNNYADIEWYQEIRSDAAIYTFECTPMGSKNYWKHIKNDEGHWYEKCGEGETCVNNKCQKAEYNPAEIKYDCITGPGTGHTVRPIIVEYKPGNGEPIWIFKNSWGKSHGENGYAYVANSPILTKGLVKVRGPITPPSSPNFWPSGFTGEIRCVDKDGDGYCNWGISKNKPSACPPTCKDAKDCDDSDPALGPFDANLQCVVLETTSTTTTVPDDSTTTTIDEGPTLNCNGYCQQEYGVEGDCRLWCSGDWWRPDTTDKCLLGFCCCEKFCQDSDEGRDYKVKGTCIDHKGSHTDYCSSANMYEYFCSNGVCQAEKIHCITCDDGTCPGKCPDEIQYCNGDCHKEYCGDGYYCDGFYESCTYNMYCPCLECTTKIPCCENGDPCDCNSECPEGSICKDGYCNSQQTPNTVTTTSSTTTIPSTTTSSSTTSTAIPTTTSSTSTISTSISTSTSTTSISGECPAEMDWCSDHCSNTYCGDGQYCDGFFEECGFGACPCTDCFTPVPCCNLGDKCDCDLECPANSECKEGYCQALNSTTSILTTSTSTSTVPTTSTSTSTVVTTTSSTTSIPSTTTTTIAPCPHEVRYCNNICQPSYCGDGSICDAFYESCENQDCNYYDCYCSVPFPCCEIGDPCDCDYECPSGVACVNGVCGGASSTSISTTVLTTLVPSSTTTAYTTTTAQVSSCPSELDYCNSKCQLSYCGDGQYCDGFFEYCSNLYCGIDGCTCYNEFSCCAIGGACDCDSECPGGSFCINGICQLGYPGGVSTVSSSTTSSTSSIPTTSISTSIVGACLGAWEPYSPVHDCCEGDYGYIGNQYLVCIPPTTTSTILPTTTSILPPGCPDYDYCTQKCVTSYCGDGSHCDAFFSSCTGCTGKLSCCPEGARCDCDAECGEGLLCYGGACMPQPVTPPLGNCIDTDGGWTPGEFGYATNGVEVGIDCCKDSYEAWYPCKNSGDYLIEYYCEDGVVKSKYLKAACQFGET